MAVPCARRSSLLLLSLALPALAQDAPRGFDAHGFVLSAHDSDIRDGLVLQRAGDLRAGDFFAGGVLEYANAPLVLQDPDTSAREVVLDHVVAGNLSLGGALHERIRLDAMLPVFFTSTGTAGGQGAGLGDIRLTAMGMVLSPSETGGWGLAAVPWIDLPTGVDREYLGERAVAGGGVAALTHDWDRVTLTANAGAQFAPATDLRNLENADSFIGGLGGAFSVRPDTGVGLEVRGRIPFIPAEVDGTGSPFEATASVRHVRHNGAFLTGGAATAITRGAGAAAFRVFVGGGFGSNVGDIGPRDRDLDGLMNREDDCPDEPETFNDFDDTDGCPDALPQLTVTVREGDAVSSGARLEVETDGALAYEGQVSEPTSVEVRPGAVAVRASRGACLAGSAQADVASDLALDVPLEPVRDALLQIVVKAADGSAVPEAALTLTPADDGCEADLALEDGLASGYVGPTTWSIAVAAPGYHPFDTGVMLVSGGDETVQVVLIPVVELTKVKVEDERIVLLEQVHFDSGRATLRKGSSDILDEVVIALQGLPRRGAVEIQGHTDNVGSDETNRKLSQSRAETVLKYLFDHGIPEDRLVAKGYGEAEPTTTNRTAEGRQANRRVEFVFLEAP